MIIKKIVVSQNWPSQFVPFIMNPSLHVQVKLPILLSQVAFAWQGQVSPLHSSISRAQKMIILRVRPRTIWDCVAWTLDGYRNELSNRIYFQVVIDFNNFHDEKIVDIQYWPSQFVPFIMNPSLHVQVKLPILLSQVAFPWQGQVSPIHSSISRG